MEKEKKFEIIENNEALIIIAGNKLSFFEVRTLKNKLIGYFGRDKKLFIFDFSDTQWIDSFGMALIAWTVKNSILTDAHVVIVNPQKKIFNLFLETRLAEIVTFENSVEKARLKIKRSD